MNRRRGPFLIGTSTWMYSSYNLHDALGKIAAVNIRNVEVWADGAHLDPRSSDESLLSIAKTLTQHRLNVCCVHLPFSNVDQANMQDQRYGYWMTLIESTLKQASDLGVKIAVIHPYAEKPEIASSETVGERSKQMVDLLKGLLPFVRKLGIRLAIENMPSLGVQKFGNSMKELRKFINKIEDEYVGLCLDTSHCVANSIDVCEEIQVCEDRLLTVHVSDNKSEGQDMHLVPGQGKIDWHEFFKCLDSINYSGPLILEVASQGRPDNILKNSYESILELTRTVHR